MCIGDGENNCLEFENKFVETHYKHAPKRTKIFQGYHKPHINNTLRF